MSELEQEYRSPVIHDVPPDKLRLIDTGMLHFESSIAGYNERYHRGETSHTIHVWWARRPHSAMRSLVFSSLCKEDDQNAAQIMSDLAMTCSKESVESARALLAAEYEESPRVLDMFGGGGTIPFEAKRLGLDAYSIDSNQLSVFIQRCNMLYADKIDIKHAVDCVREIGERVLYSLKSKTEWLYPLRTPSMENTFGYIWTYRIECPHCKHRFILSKRPWLSTKSGRKIGMIGVSANNGESESLSVHDCSDGTDPFNPHWVRHVGTLICPHCNSVVDNVDILNCEDVMTALIMSRQGSGKDFVNAEQATAIPPNEEIEKEENRLLNRLGAELPKSELPVWSGIVNPALYGVKTHSDFLNRRQRLLLLYLIDELDQQYTILAKTNVDLAKFVIGALSSLLDQVIDWNCRLSMWISQGEQVGRGFCGPGVAMLFDYAETDQLLHGPANLWDKLDRIVKGVSSFENCTGKVSIQHAHAQELPFSDSFFDAIVTDPPYYDNIYYSILADFFYAWKKILLKRIEPELFENSITDSKYELVASTRRVEEGQSAHEEYCKQLSKAFAEASRVLKDDGVFTFVYSHSSVNGWEAVIRAYRNSDFLVSSVQPLSIERKGRPRAVLSQAVNTCMTIVARKEKIQRAPIELSTLLSKAKEISNEFGKMLMDKSGWSQADAGLAVIACAVGLIANSSEVLGVSSDADALIAVSKIIKSDYPDFTIKVRDSL